LLGHTIAPVVRDKSGGLLRTATPTPVATVKVPAAGADWTAPTSQYPCRLRRDSHRRHTRCTYSGTAANRVGSPWRRRSKGSVGGAFAPMPDVVLRLAWLAV